MIIEAQSGLLTLVVVFSFLLILLLIDYLEKRFSKEICCATSNTVVDFPPLNKKRKGLQHYGYFDND
jgi:hypothetical protein